MRAYIRRSDGSTTMREIPSPPPVLYLSPDDDGIPAIRQSNYIPNLQSAVRYKLIGVWRDIFGFESCHYEEG